jgi:hypothetical protein
MNNKDALKYTLCLSTEWFRALNQKSCKLQVVIISGGHCWFLPRKHNKTANLLIKLVYPLKNHWLDNSSPLQTN